MAGSTSPRTAYLITKLAVFAVVALLTWPLARVVGPRAWWGLAVFGVILGAVSLVVLPMLGRRPMVGSGADDTTTGGDQPDIEAPVALPVEDRIDLHPFTPRDIPDVVADYLVAAHEAGFREVRLIHGRGIGVQRERVRSVLKRHPLVESFHDATPDRGGWGATIAFLSQRDGNANDE
jgi:hypothetical protein